MNPLLAFTAWSAQGTFTDRNPQNKGSHTRVVQIGSHHYIHLSALTDVVNVLILSQIKMLMLITARLSIKAAHCFTGYKLFI